MNKDEALKLALATLEEGNFVYPTALRTAIEAALAQPVVKPCHSPYCECAEGKCTHPGCYDVRHEPFEFPEPTPEQLAALGWQSIECPFCGTSGAKAFPKPDCDWEGIAADQAMTIALMKSEQPEQEPLEYWNAVEGGVKIGEVRQHFETVSCGTIYKTGGEGRVPLYTTPPKREWVGLTEMDIRNIFPHASYPLFLKTVSAIEAKLKELNHEV